MRQHELITVKLLAIVAVRLGQFRVDWTTGISITLYTNVVAELFYWSSPTTLTPRLVPGWGDVML